MSQNISEELDKYKILQKLNDDKAEIYYEAIVFLGVLIPIGIISNLHVLLIYYFKKPNNSTRIFVCFLAANDLVACAFCFPFNIVSYMNPLTYYDDPSCRIFFFLGGCVLIGSALTLLAIAIERYRKICKPFLTQVSLTRAKLMCAIVLALAVLGSIPLLVLYGSTEISTTYPNITGYECHVHVELRDSAFQMIHGGLLLIASFVCCVALTVLYILIGVRIWKHQAKMRKNKVLNISVVQDEDRSQNKETDKAETVSIQTTSGFVEARQPDIQNDESRRSESSEQETNFPLSTDKSKQDQEQLDKFKQMKRTTYMFTWVTALYVIGILPFPIVRLYQVFNTDWHNDNSHYALVTIFLNNVINSFVYTICDSNYRKELKSFYGKILWRN